MEKNIQLIVKQTYWGAKMPDSKASPRTVKARRREQNALALREEGRTYSEIAASIGYSDASGAARAVLRGLSALGPGEEVEAQRQLECERLDRLQESVWEKARAGDLDCLSAVLRISERRCRLLGLDAAQKLDIWAGGRRVLVDMVRAAVKGEAPAKDCLFEIVQILHDGGILQRYAEQFPVKIRFNLDDVPVEVLRLLAEEDDAIGDDADGADLEIFRADDGR